MTRPQIYNPAIGAILKITKGRKVKVDSIIIPVGGTFSFRTSGGGTNHLQIDNSTAVKAEQYTGPFLFMNNAEDTELHCDVAGLILFGVEDIQ